MTGIHDVPPDFIAAQIDAVFSDLEVDAVKIGMLSRAGRDRRGGGRARSLAGRRNVVLDPVMVATSGDRLLDARRDRRCSSATADPARAASITPNLPEAAALLDAPLAADESEMRAQAERAARARRQGRADQGRPRRAAPKASICWSTPTASRGFAAPRIATRNTHGTGCTLSSAIAAGLAKGASARRGRARRQDLRHRARSRAADELQRSATATARCIISMPGGRSASDR